MAHTPSARSALATSTTAILSVVAARNALDIILWILLSTARFSGVCTACAACALGLCKMRTIFPALTVFGASVLQLILPVLAAVWTPHTRRVLQNSQYEQYPDRVSNPEISNPEILPAQAASEISSIIRTCSTSTTQHHHAPTHLPTL